MKKLISIILFLAVVFTMFAAEKLEEVKVTDLKERLVKAGVLKDVIIQTDVVTEEEIEKKQADTVSEAVDNEMGIQSATGCSMCGMKRIRINGMKGEHTTVLVDDVPMHSTVSSYYGMDALTTAGIASIEVARGSGASLIAPGAMGGVINIKFKKALKNEIITDLRYGDNDYKGLSVTGTGMINEGRTRSTVAAQYNKQGQFDADDNGVNESPEIENYSVSARVSHDFNLRNNLDVRLTTQKSDVFGGPVVSDHYGAMQGTEADDESFEGNNVNNDFNGNPLSTLEAITTKRDEAIVKWSHHLNDRINFVTSASGSKQIQDSVYEGADYYSEDETYYGDIRMNYLVHDDHLLTTGVDTKQEHLWSRSNEFYNVLGLDKDDFEMSSMGVYLQDVWTPVEAVEVSAAVRLDKINVDWTDKGDDDEIDDFVVVPRLHVRWNHGDLLVSRFSAGRGYRAPLTFFESEHGVLEDGFGIEVEDIETSMSAGYSLSLDTDRVTSTVSFNYTQVENLAIITDEHDYGYDGFALVNSDETHEIIVLDGVVGYQLFEPFNVAVSYEHFMYNDEYKAEQFLAQIEDRAKLMLDFDMEGWMANLTGTWVGGRDLTEYGYEGYDEIDDEGNVIASSMKDTDAPAYYTIDAKISKTVLDHITLYVGAKNLLDYTQTDDDVSPLMYDADGGYDVGYIWGPLRGRQIYAGIQARL